HNIRAILIAGDLFDSERIFFSTMDIVKDCITGNPEIDFLYTTGDKENDAFINALNEVPDNLKFFDEDHPSYRYDDRIVITAADSPDDLSLNSTDINIVMHHGAVRPELWRGKYIDYLALGHYHSLKEGSLGSRGRYCYSGCLEGRGFDECGEKGFVRLEIERGIIKPIFVQAAKRVIHAFTVDINDAAGTSEVDKRIQKALLSRDIPGDDLVKVELVGSPDPEFGYNAEYIEKKYGEKYFAFCLVKAEGENDEDLESSEYDKSLKGEFIRLCQKSHYSEDEKNQIIRLGLAALEGRKEALR
nr:DNA repair exonuclease [Lachnospiraceae bacterium]